MSHHSGMTIVFQTDTYTIGLVNDTQYEPDSSDNVTAYKKFYTDIHEGYRYSSRHGVYVFVGSEIENLACVCSSGGATTIHPTCAVLDANHIILCCGDSIFNLTIPELDLSWRTKTDSATCFEIFKHDEGYIIHGELEISRLDKDGSIVWQFSGSDIFTTHTGENDFVLDADIIYAKDWNGLKFNLDANTGKQLEQ